MKNDVNSFRRVYCGDLRVKQTPLSKGVLEINLIHLANRSSTFFKIKIARYSMLHWKFLF